MNPQDDEELESSINRVLRRLPDRKAPPGFESRVMAELSRRAALPWWRKSFAHWPSAARAVFFVISAVAAGLVVAGLFFAARSAGASQLSGNLSGSFAWFVVARDIVAAAGARLSMIAASVPPLWLYGIGGLVALCYATLGAVGAAAYRAFSPVRQAS
jgi:hypothetical protein